MNRQDAMGPDDPPADPSAIERALAQIADDLVVALQALRAQIDRYGPDLAICGAPSIESDDRDARPQDAGRPDLDGSPLSD